MRSIGLLVVNAALLAVSAPYQENLTQVSDQVRLKATQTWNFRLRNNIGIKHVFLCINICWAAREMLKPEPERRGFQPLPRCPADVNVSEKHV